VKTMETTIKQIPLPQRPKKQKPKLTQTKTVVLSIPQTSVSKARRNRRRRKNNGNNADAGPEPVITSPSGLLQNYLMPQPVGVSTGRSNMARSLNAGIRRAFRQNGISKQGLSFLKCAFSAPDFDGTNVYGVPDDFGGKSLCVKHRAVTPAAFAADVDYYFMLAPVPGIAYYSLKKTAGVPVDGTETWIPTPYANFQKIFPTNLTGNYIAQKFRMVSSHFELICTTNNNNWTGNVQAFKLPMQMYEAQATPSGTNYYALSGLDGIVSTDADMYSGPFNLGVYTGSFNKGAKFDFQEVLRNQLGLPDGANFNPAGGDFGALAAQIPGFDNNFETTIIKISGIGANPSNTALIKSWACVEYQFTPGSVNYESQVLHTDCDEVALKIYKKLICELPVGVSYLDNANFWNRVLSVLASMGMALSAIPGPYGAIAGGVGAISSGLRDLTM